MATIEVSSVVCAGDLALLISTWHLYGSGSGGNPVAIAGQTSDVARRRSDGSWRFAIDNSWGDAAIAG